MHSPHQPRSGPHFRTCLSTGVALCCMAWPWVAHAQSTGASTPDVLTRLISLEARFASVKVAGGPERMGLLGTALLADVGAHWWVGPVVVGAAAGQRGGLFVLGGQVERRWQWGATPWQGRVSLMAGGGGGANAPVGGGLMLQPAASVLYNFGPLQAGLSVSRVAFPQGHIAGKQMGAVVSWDGRFPYFDVAGAGQTLQLDGRTGLGFDRVLLDTAHLTPSVRKGVATPAMRLVGVRAEQRLGPHGYWGVEAAAATQGGADGYMELLGTAGWEATASGLGVNQLAWGVRGALGLGGGGAVPTGAGSLAKVAGLLRWDFSRHTFLGLEAGVAQSGDARYKAHFTQVLAGWQFDHPSAGTDFATVVAMEATASMQHTLRAARKDGRASALDTLGVQVNRWISPQFYVSGQAHSAFAGGAGAYSMGLAGMGWAVRVADTPWRVGAELLAGAAGGGGVATQGGAVGQGVLKLGCQPSANRIWQWDVGYVRSQRGGLSSPVLGVSWVQRYGVAQR